MFRDFSTNRKIFEGGTPVLQNSSGRLEGVHFSDCWFGYDKRQLWHS